MSTALDRLRKRLIDNEENEVKEVAGPAPVASGAAPAAGGSALERLQNRLGGAVSGYRESDAALDRRDEELRRRGTSLLADEWQKKQDYYSGLMQSADYSEKSRNSAGLERLTEPKYRLMTDEQKGLFNYLQNTAGDWKSNEYLEHIAWDLNRRQGQQEAQELQEKTGLAKLGGLAKQTTLDTMKNFGDNLERFGDMLEGDRMVKAPTVHEYASGYTRDSIESPLGKAAYDLATTTSNMLPSIGASIVSNIIAPGSGALVGSALMGAASAGGTYADELRQGRASEDAARKAAVTGGMESGLQYALGGVSALGGKLTGGKIAKMVSNIDNVAKRIGARFVASGVSEGVEEYLQEMLAPVVSNWAYGENEDVPLFTEDGLYAFALAFASAGLLEGGSIITGEIKANEVGKAFTGTPEVLVQRAGQMGTDTEAYQLAQKFASGEIKANAANLGNLFIRYRQDGGDVRGLMQDVAATAASKPQEMDTMEDTGDIPGSEILRRAAEEMATGKVDAETLAEITRNSEALKELGVKLDDTMSGKAQRNAVEQAMQKYKPADKPGMGEAGVRSMKELSNAEQDAELYSRGFTAVYENSGTGREYTPEEREAIASLSAEQLEGAARAAAEDAGARQTSGLIRNEARRKAKLTARQADVIDRMGKALGVRISFVDRVAGGSANGRYVASNNTIEVALDSENPFMTVVKHEVTHRLQTLDKKSYEALRRYAVALEGSGAVKRQQELYAKLGMDPLSTEEAMDEVVCNFTEKILRDEDALQRLIREAQRDAEKRTAGEKLLAVIRKTGDKLAKAIARKELRAIGEAQYGEYFRLVERAERMWFNAFGKAAKAGKNTARTDGAKYTIKELPNGYRYVQADRQVIFGDDPNLWGKQIETFINEQIRKGEDVLFPTTDGHVLALTERSAYKLSDRHKSQIGKKARELLSDEEFALKGQIAGHIDELIQVGIFDGYEADRDGAHENDIGEDGFNYFNAFFKDGGENGGYYRVRFSSALNDADETAYSIGDIQKRRFPSRDGSSGNAGALNGTRKPSDITNTTNAGKSQEKTAMARALEAAAENAGKKLYSLKDSEGKKLTQEQIEFFKDSKVRDENGNLMAVYHGTPGGGFTEFKLPKYMSSLMAAHGAGYYFTNKANAKQYTKQVNKTTSGKKQVYEVYLNITNPLVVTAGSPVTITKEQVKEIARRGDYEWFKTSGMAHQAGGDRAANKTLPYEELLDKWAEKVIRTAYYDSDILSELVHNYTGEGEILQAMQDVLGYDGVRFTDRYGDIWVAWNANQIKSTTNKTPTSDPDIRYSLKGGERTGIGYDEETESAMPVRYSLKTWSESAWVKARRDAAADLAGKLGIDKEKALSYIDAVNGIAKMIADDRVRLDYEAAPGMSAFVGNSEYGGSIDFSTICKKRRLFTGTFEAIQEALPNTALTADEFLQIRSMMAEKGYEVSCGMCYVEGSRANMGQYTKLFLDRYKETNPKYLPTMAEMNTATGQEKIRRQHPEVYEAYEYFMNHNGRLKPTDKAIFAGQQKPKMYQLATEYQGEVLKKFKGKAKSVAAKNENGGLRLQSFSDFEIIHLLDAMQVIMDMSAVGLAGQAYTKVPDFAWALGDTGLKINLSLVAKGVDSKGKLILDEVEGMREADAMALRDRYSDNVGTIVVVFTDRQLKAAMADDRIDFIIPFHRSQWKTEQYESMGLPKNPKDYTPWQNESYIKPVYNANGKKQRPVNFMPNAYWDFSKSGRENAEIYLRMCAENNRRPKFHYLLVNNGDGSYSLQPDGSTDGYWKTLIDFKMYSNEGAGVPQRPVRPDFNIEQAQRMLREYEGGHSKFPAAQDVVREFVEQYKRKMPEGTRFSVKDSVVGDTNREHIDNFGTIDPGEIPYRETEVPKKTGKNKNVSQTVRTILEAEVTPDAIVQPLAEMIRDGSFSFESIGDKESLDRAEAKVKRDGWQAAYGRWMERMGSGKVTKDDVVTGWALYNAASNAGDIKTAIDIVEAQVKNVRSAAQALQAVRVLKRMSPDAQLYGIVRSVESLVEELKQKYGDKVPDLEVDEVKAREFLRADSQEKRDEIMEEIYRDIGKQMPSTFMDKWNAWRYLAMLGNPRTHVRNVMGNLGFAPLVGAKNAIARGLEKASKTSQRTKSKVTRSKDASLLEAASEDYANAVRWQETNGKYSDAALANKYIQEGRTIFKNKGLEYARKKNSELLEKEDQLFSQRHYASALASYCKANGISEAKLRTGEGLDKAREYALREAEKATYRDVNAFSEAVSKLGRYRGKNKAMKAASLFVEGVLPFRKTPANILVRGVEYSPIGLMKGLTADLWKVKRGEMMAYEAIDNIAAGLTGTGLLLLGALLGNLGVIRGRGAGDDDEREYDELKGHQAYALEVGGKSVTLDWLAPEALPLFVGVNLVETMMESKDGLTMADIITNFSNVSEPMLGMTCLQSLNDLIDSVGYASSDGLSALPSMLASAATSYLTQAIPTILGQAERSGQGVRMTTYTDKNNRWLTSDMQYTIGRASSRLPGVDFNQIPYIDAWGRTESSGSVVGNAFNNFLNPAYYSEYGETEMDAELERLYNANTDAGVFPSRAGKYFTVDGVRKDLTAEEYVEYATLKGTVSRTLVEAIVSQESYKRMSDEEKAKAVKECYNLANQMAKVQIAEGYDADKWVAQSQEAAQKYKISQDTFVVLKAKASAIDSLKDKNGDTIENSRGLQIMKAVYDTPGMTEAQRKAMFDYLGVGSKIKHFNKALVNQKLEQMKRQAK